MFLLAILAKNTGRPGGKTGAINSARDEINEVSARRVTGNPENIVYYTCRNLEIRPSIEISLSSVTALCMLRCTRIMHLLHAFSASVMKSLLFLLWI